MDLVSSRDIKPFINIIQLYTIYKHSNVFICFSFILFFHSCLYTIHSYYPYNLIQYHYIIVTHYMSTLSINHYMSTISMNHYMSTISMNHYISTISMNHSTITGHFIIFVLQDLHFQCLCESLVMYNFRNILVL